MNAVATALEAEWLTPVLLKAATAEATAQGESMLVALQRLSQRTPDEVLRAAAHRSGLAALTLPELEAMTPDFSLVSYGECLERECLVAADGQGMRYFVSSNPLDDALYTWATHKIEGYFRLAFTHPLELKAMLARLEAHQQAISQVIRLEQGSASRDAGSESEKISLRSIARDESQVVRLVNSTLYDAHKNGASDIHFENTPMGLVIKYRVDGVLGAARQLPDVSLAEQVISRVKVMAELDIGEKRIPQDGRFAVNIGGREIDFRVSVMPGLFGEDAVLRILDKQSLTAELAQLNLDLLGIEARAQDTIRRLASQPYGMLLVTGPTGSGKTTTLYATLSEINHGDDKIITIEDPVEYQLPGVLQIPVNERKGLTFAKGLRSILRHDPDRILVGEIRDRETAEIAVQAALTGHLVFTTVHANNVFDVLSRFRHMGVDAYSFVTALNGVIAQRLVRINCSHCLEPSELDDDVLRASGVERSAFEGFSLKRGRGCAHCRGTGYKGRRALTEVLVMNDELRELILQQAPISRLKEVARTHGMASMREEAIEAVKQGQTTLQEINRVTFVE
ncbi:general secretion pathway protein E [Variovorax boronicumulans]|uniref:General secretion pathway protein E n=1 Tax=Variovorax boronicumulans TaxID=436515 RepID=A0AAW8DRI5_9BURK|nr:GspE/PulE family protein [Variovorax boronicumulans]MDP9877267.1 general secretion pathway protein E [Variovorax boronicumulans]MDP9921856.1 general secretion pathway protein E [Variovorax boronicumulans]